MSGSKFCSQCGKPTGGVNGSWTPPGAYPSGAREPSVDFMAGDNAQAALAYLVLPAIYFLVSESHQGNRFVRFHSYQALFYCGFVGAGLWVVWNILGAVLGLYTFVVLWLGTLFSFVYWAKTIIRTYQGQMVKIPLIGELAEKRL